MMVLCICGGILELGLLITTAAVWLWRKLKKKQTNYENNTRT